MMSRDELMMMEAEGWEAWNEEVDDEWGVGSDAWMTDLINEKIERELHREFSWY